MTKKRSTKRALLLSALSLLMCVSMLIGSTFAWFTDEVKSGTNIIAAGNLDVELYYSKTKDFSAKEKVDGKTVLFTDKDGNEIKYWEPGVVAYTNLQVANVGSLALTYRMTVNSFATNYVQYADGTKYDLTDVLKVAVVKDGFEGDRAAAKGLTFEAIESFTLSGELEADKKSEVYGVVIYWEPNNNDFDNLFNMNNGKSTSNGEPLSIELGITLSATQEEFEKDSFDEKYDEEASYLVNAGEIVTFKPEEGSANLEMEGLVENNGVLNIVDTSIKNDGVVIENSGVANLTNVVAEVVPGKPWGGYFTNGIGEDSYTVFENVDATTLGGGVQLDDAARAIFKSGSITTNSTSTSARHVFYLLDGSQITIESGDFKFSPTNLTRKGYYVCATYGSEVIIKGGNFDKPSTRGDYKAGFYADATSSITVYGGTFKFDPTPWVADGYISTKNADGTYTVVKGAVVANATDLKDAIAAGGNIVLNDDIELTGTLVANKDVVIDLNGKKMTVPSSGAIFQSQSNAAPDMIITSSVAGAEINVSGGDTSVLLGYGSTVINNVTINVNGCDNASPNPFKAFGDLTLGEGTVVNVDYLGTALISNNGAHAIVVDGAKINVGTFKTNGTAIITLNASSTLKIKNTDIKIGEFVLSAFGGDSLVSKVDGVTIENTTFNVTDSNGASCTFVAKDGKYRLVQE